MIVSPLLILQWMFTLIPIQQFHTSFYTTAIAIADAANEDADPLDAAATLTAVGFFESHFDPSAWSRESDPTVSYGVFQLSLQWVKLPVPVTVQAKTALKLVRDSQMRCGSLAMYASGSCNAGREAAEDRAKLAYRLLHPQWLERRLPQIRKHN